MLLQPLLVLEKTDLSGPGITLLMCQDLLVQDLKGLPLLPSGSLCEGCCTWIVSNTIDVSKNWLSLCHIWWHCCTGQILQELCSPYEHHSYLA